MNNIETMKLALEALETNNKAWKSLADSGDAGWWEAEEQPFYEISVKAITALRQAIEQAEQYNATSDHCLMENAQGDLERIKLVQTGVGIGNPEQEPVAWAWRSFDPDDGHYGSWGSWTISDYKPPRQPDKWFQVISLPFDTPPQRQPLTDEEIERLIFRSGGHKSTQNLMSNPMQVREYVELWNERIYKFARAIEAAHGIKGEA